MDRERDRWLDSPMASLTSKIAWTVLFVAVSMHQCTSASMHLHPSGLSIYRSVRYCTGMQSYDLCVYQSSLHICGISYTSSFHCLPACLYCMHACVIVCLSVLLQVRVYLDACVWIHIHRERESEKETEREREFVHMCVCVYIYIHGSVIVPHGNANLPMAAALWA